MQKIQTHYDILKVTRDAPEPVIRASCRALMQMYHPENFQGREYEALEVVKIIRDSYEVLIDAKAREEHDRWINEQEGYALNS